MRVTDITPKNANGETKERWAAYGRVSSKSAEQLHSFAAQIRYYKDYFKNRSDCELVDLYMDEEIIYGEQKIINLRNRSYFFTENINELLEHKPKTIEKKWRICYTIKKIIC